MVVLQRMFLASKCWLILNIHNQNPIRRIHHMKRDFRQMLEAQWAKGKCVCVGLDPEEAKIPIHLRRDFKSVERMVLVFCRAIIDATKDVACAFKPNSAFFEGIGIYGEEILTSVIAHIHESAPEVPVILDAKRADIGNTNKGYAESA